MYDRLAHGYVIDFLDFHFRSYHWPSFNVADSALVAGVGLLALEILRDDRTAKAAGRV
jgi:signal peptidase II